MINYLYQTNRFPNFASQVAHKQQYNCHLKPSGLQDNQIVRVTVVVWFVYQKARFQNRIYSCGLLYIKYDYPSVLSGVFISSLFLIFGFVLVFIAYFQKMQVQYDIKSGFVKSRRSCSCEERIDGAIS